MATIEKRSLADGRFVYRVRIRTQGGNASRTFALLTEARRWARDTETDLGRRTISVDQTRVTLGEVIERYSQEKLPELKDRRKRAAHLQWWDAKLGRLRLVDLTSAVISKARLELETSPVRATGGRRAAAGEPGRRSAATANRYLASLSAVLGWARKELKLLSGNPASDVTRRQEPAGRVRFLDDEERERLLAAVAASDDWRLSPLVVAALYTGARRGELLSLRWRDVDLARRFATVHDTKNGEARSLPLAPPVLEVLRQLQRSRRRIGSDLVFGDFRFPRQAWSTALDRSGLVDFTFHDLRHTAASYFAMTGASLRDLAELLGHKTLAMVKRYSHLTREHLLTAADRMAEQFPSGPRV